MKGRTQKVLDLVTERYIRSAKPVPSSDVAALLRVSSATVRNEFSKLEEAGYLAQPHTSAGRVPTTRGFRRYARSFLPPQPLPAAQRALLSARLRGAHGEGLLQRVASVAAELSGYAVVVSLPAEDDLFTLEVHLSPLSDTHVLAVVVLQNGLVRQLALEITPAPSERDLRDAESSLRQLALPVREFPVALSDIARREAEGVARTFLALVEAWPQLQAPRFFSYGLRNLLTEPESADPSFVRLALERAERPTAVPATSGEPEQGDAVTLFFEESLALVSAPVGWGELQARLFLLGPVRMRYPESLMIARGVADTVAERFGSFEGAVN
ncbi:DeoR family transcriptional regulator [Truepera radiovictrix]|uniref:Heat-inducible transcription repressor HrcA n=1 Tax=Truepera radiovictrix (strain DSM 17093 / CIP 108686 / LMG 22925 / RQ-24) TaxID=649638 RepID=D7CSF7_TRURR|nr:DeoR family transcriptional regulator [Truepera radiovictrix]ADI15377.1 Negative regulator of class I heat shock protein [Truepera radiovictrix DSM 17093]WMT56072.1 DeoR family transcriptional regulator [Truepera radiovictrix]